MIIALTYVVQGGCIIIGALALALGVSLANDGEVGRAIVQFGLAGANAFVFWANAEIRKEWR